jgi:hypothetical protein
MCLISDIVNSTFQNKDLGGTMSIQLSDHRKPWQKKRDRITTMTELRRIATEIESYDNKSATQCRETANQVEALLRDMATEEGCEYR